MSQTDSSQPQLFDIVFRGDILPGHQLLQVKQRMAQLFKADEKRINALFSGGAVVLKKGIDRATADKYSAVLSKAGAEVQVAQAGKTAKKTKPVQRPSTVEKISTISSASKVKSATLQERLVVQAAALAPQALTPAADTSDEPGGLSLAAVGTDVLKPDERQSVEQRGVDVSAMSLRLA